MLQKIWKTIKNASTYVKICNDSLISKSLLSSAYAKTNRKQHYMKEKMQ